jgi:hypothetical protein
MRSPSADRDFCVWCGARPLRDRDDGRIVTWANVPDDTDCFDHETAAGC